jgi:hypothetical protein
MKTVFVEGMDCVGKSTLIDGLLGPFDLTHHFMFPAGTSEDEQYFYQYGQFEAMFRNLDYLEKSGFEHNFIFDRSHIGEYVWGPYYRNKFPLYLPRLEHDFYVEHQDSTSVVLLICSDKSIIKYRFEQRGEPMPKAWMKLQDMFIEAVEKNSPFDSIIYDTAVYDSSTLIEICKEKIKREN